MSEHAIMLIALVIAILGLVTLGVILWDMRRHSDRMFRAVAGLVVQESERIRSLLRDQ